MFDLNDAEPQKTGEVIPDGSFVKVTLAIRPGGVDGQSEIDRGLLKASNQVGSDVLMLDCEFTVVEGSHARRKFWQMLSVSGGKLDDKGVSIAWKISKSTIRAMIDSALGLEPKDMSEAAKARRIIRGFADLAGITFIAKVKVEHSEEFGDKNLLDYVVLPSQKEWKKVMEGEEVPPSPSSGGNKKETKANPPAQQPAWGQAATAPAAAPTWQQPSAAPVPQAPAPAPQAPAWQRPAPAAPSQPASAQPAPVAPAQPAPAAQGPAWLNG